MNQIFNDLRRIKITDKIIVKVIVVIEEENKILIRYFKYFISYTQMLFLNLVFSSIVKKPTQIFIFVYDITFNYNDNIQFSGTNRRNGIRRSMTYDILSYYYRFHIIVDIDE